MWIELNCRKIPTVRKVKVLCGLARIIGKFLQFERYGLNQSAGNLLRLEKSESFDSTKL